MKTLSCLLASFAITFVAFANQPTTKENSVRNRIKNSSLADNTAFQAMYVFLQAEHADVRAGKTVIFSSVVKVTRWQLENDRESILSEFEGMALKAFPRKLIHITTGSLSEGFASKEIAVQAREISISTQLNHQYTTQLLDWKK